MSPELATRVSGSVVESAPVPRTALARQPIGRHAGTFGCYPGNRRVSPARFASATPSREKRAGGGVTVVRERARVSVSIAEVGERFPARKKTLRLRLKGERKSQVEFGASRPGVGLP